MNFTRLPCMQYNKFVRAVKFVDLSWKLWNFKKEWCELRLYLSKISFLSIMVNDLFLICYIFFKGAIGYAQLARRSIYSSSKKAEVRVIIVVLRNVRKLQLDQLLILTDSIEVIHAIEEKKDWILKIRVADIFALAKSFAFINFWHFFRALNIATHELTKFCSKFDMESEYFDSNFLTS